MSFSSREASALVEVDALLGLDSRQRPPQNVWPTTEACCSTRRSWAESESSRAASTACTVSGSVWTSLDPPSRIRLTISSAKRGLPAERSATCGTSSAPFDDPPFDSAGGPRRGRGSPRGSAARAPSWSRCAARLPSLGAGRGARHGPCTRSARGRAPIAPDTRSDRACPRLPNGCPRSRSRRASGGRPPRSGTGRREEAVAHLLRVLGIGAAGDRGMLAGGSIPSGRASVAARRSGDSSVCSSEITDSTPAGASLQASSESSVSTISNWPRTISPSAQ